MKKIALTESYDKKLNRLAPSFLKGERRTTQRIKWAIDELHARIAAERKLTRKEQTNAA